MTTPMIKIKITTRIPQVAGLCAAALSFFSNEVECRICSSGVGFEGSRLVELSAMPRVWNLP